MASRKRSRESRDVGNEAIEIESASSSFRMSSQHKRSRVALAAEQGGSAVSDDDDNDDTDLTLGDSFLDEILEDDDLYMRDDSVAPSEVVSEVLNDFDDDEEMQLKAARIMEKERRRQAHLINVPSEKGVIEEVFCRNFMCHAKLRIKLGPLINFIIGHNGSGKSAVLTALTMCLGAKASATNRAGSLKKLIKEGEDSASLAVKIRNCGDDAYKPELYGTSITVERHFNQAGTSGFKIRNEQDKVITTKRADLDDLLDYFAFQLDNPINVLTQDMARQFLSNSSPAQKYKLFIRGTQLESLHNDYNLLEENIDSLQEKLANRKDDIAHLKEKAKEAQQKKQRAGGWKELEAKIEGYRQQHAWWQVQEQENYLGLLEKNHAQATERIARLQQAEVDAEGVLEGHTQAADRATLLLQQLTDGLQPCEEAASNAEEAWKAHTDALKETNVNFRNIKDDIKGHTNEINNYERQIEEENARLSAAEGDEQAERLRRLEELKEECVRARETLEQFEGRLPELLKEVKTSRDTATAAKAEFEDKRDLVKQAEAKVKQVSSSQGRPFDGYPKGTDILVQRINQETRWREKPVGPLGQHVRLLNLEWQRQIEKMLGSSLNGFAVTNPYDKNLLTQIARQVGVSPTVFVGSKAPIDTRPNEPPEDILTIMRALRIDDEFVRKTLVINHGIEQIALTSSRPEAIALISGPNRVKNVKAAVAIHDRTGGVSFSLTRSGDLQTSPVLAYDGMTRMKTDKEEQIRAERSRLEFAKREESAAESTKRELERAAIVAEQAKTKHARETMIKKTVFQQVEDAVEELQNEIESNRPQDGKLQELGNMLDMAREALKVSQSALEKLTNQKDDRTRQGKTLLAALEAAQAELKAEQARVDQQQEKVESVSNAKREAARDKDRIYNELQSAKRIAEDVRLRVTDQKAVVEDHTREASIISTRVEVEEGMDATVLDKKISDLIAQLEDLQRAAGGTEEQLVNAWKAAHQAFARAVKEYRGHVQLGYVLARTLSKRRQRWGIFRGFIALRARFTFGYLLSERNFRGTVLVNHTDKELDIKVEPDIAQHSDNGRETTTLSGGEKSFSQICLLLSIWDAMGSPIRCLDEFDVFMDNVNRKASMDMMIQAARRAVGRQFILITPQAMNNVEIGEDVRIHKMSDPERGQTSLPY